MLGRSATGQDEPAEPELPPVLTTKDAKAFQKTMRPGTPYPRRSRAIEAITSYDNADAAKLLTKMMIASFQEVVKLEKQRQENEKKINNLMIPRVKGSSEGLVDYTGIEEWQKVQERIGRQITLEEKVIRLYRACLRRLTDEAARIHLRKLRVKKPLALRLFMIDLFRHFDEDPFTELLIDHLSDRQFDIRLAAADSLSHHAPERVPPNIYGGLLNADEWQARAVAIEALGRRGGPEAVSMLIERTALEKGRLLTDVCDRLEILTGQKFGNTPAAWISWWGQNKNAYQSDRVVLTRPVKAEREGETRYWGITIDSLRVVFVIDVSGTMAADLKDPDDYAPDPGKARLDIARREVKNTIASLPSDAKFNVISYNDFVIRWEERGVSASPKNKQRAYAFLDDLFPFGATNIYDSLEAAFRVSAPGIKDKYYDQSADTILFLSDGGPTAGKSTDMKEILAAVKEWNRVKKVTLHVIGIGKQINKPFLDSLAKDNFGEIRYID